MSELDDIFRNLDLQYQFKYTKVADTKPTEYPTSPEEAKQEIKALFLELIGEDDALDSTAFPFPNIMLQIKTRNSLRGELRQKVEEL